MKASQFDQLVGVLTPMSTEIRGLVMSVQDLDARMTNLEAKVNAPLTQVKAGKAAPAAKAGKAKSQAKASTAAPKAEKPKTPEQVAHAQLAESVRKTGGKLAPLGGDGTSKPKMQAWAEEREGGMFFFARTLTQARRALGTLPAGLELKEFSTHAYKQTSTWWVAKGSIEQAQDFAKKVK